MEMTRGNNNSLLTTCAIGLAVAGTLAVGVYLLLNAPHSSSMSAQVAADAQATWPKAEGEEILDKAAKSFAGGILGEMLQPCQDKKAGQQFLASFFAWRLTNNNYWHEIANTNRATLGTCLQPGDTDDFIAKMVDDILNGMGNGWRQLLAKLAESDMTAVFTHLAELIVR